MSATYGALKAQVADWLERDDLTAQIPSFIRQAETKIYRGLRTRENEFTKTYVGSADPAELTNPLVLPQNFREVKLVLVNGRQAMRVSDQEYFARELSQPDNWETTEYFYFAIIERALYVQPWPEVAPADWEENKIELVYYGTESLGEMATWDTPTNPNQTPESNGTPPGTSMRDTPATTRLLQVAPDLYLYATLAEGYKYLREPQKAMEYEQMAAAVLESLILENAEAEYAGSTLAVSSIYHDTDWR